MSRLWDNRLVKNRFGQVRSGWIILIAMAAYYLLSFVSNIVIIEVLRKILIARRYQSGNRRGFQPGGLVQ